MRVFTFIAVAVCLLAGGLYPAAGQTESSETIPTPEPALRTALFTIDQPAQGVGYRIPALLITERGTILVFCERRDGLGDHAKNDIVLRRSTDGGKTWSDIQVIDDRGDDSLNDPCCVQRPDGTILLMYQRYPYGYHTGNFGSIKMASPGYDGPTCTQSFLVTSSDEGATWSEPRDISRMVRPEKVVAIGSPGIGIVLQHGDHKGRLVLPTYQVNVDGSHTTACVYSDDGGQTWQIGQTIDEEGPDRCNESQLVELADGRILFSARVEGVGGRKIAFSADGGENFTPYRVQEDLVTPACMSAVIPFTLPDGKTVILHSIPHGKGRKNGVVFIDRDGRGERFAPLLRVTPDGFAYSCLGQAADGSLVCVYETDGYRTITLATYPIEQVAELVGKEE